MIGLTAAIGGIVLLVGASTGFPATSSLGDGLGVVTAAFYAAYLFTVKQLREGGAAALPLMAIVSSVTALVLLSAVVASEQRMLPISQMGWLKLLGLALVSQSAGQGLIAHALAQLSVALSSVSLLLQPVFAAMFARVLLAEPMTLPQFGAELLVLAGLYVARCGAAFPPSLPGR